NKFLVDFGPFPILKISISAAGAFDRAVISSVRLVVNLFLLKSRVTAAKATGLSALLPIDSPPGTRDCHAATPNTARLNTSPDNKTAARFTLINEFTDFFMMVFNPRKIELPAKTLIPQIFELTGAVSPSDCTSSG